MNITTADTIMLYIPSKYEISSDDSENVHKLHFLEINDDGTIPIDYAGNPDDVEIEEKYRGVNLEKNKDGENIEKYLEESYKCPVSLGEIGKDDISEIKDIFRQLRRLKFCIQGLKYKLCIFYKYYVCCIRRDDTYECYSIDNFKSSKNRSLVVSIDLESLYEKISTIDTDVKSIRKGIFNVLDRNQVKQVYTLQRMMEYKANFHLLSTGVTNEKRKQKAYLEKLEGMLENLKIAQQKIMEDIVIIEEKYSNKKALHYDIEKVHALSKKEEEFTKINEVKKEIIGNILKVKSIIENISLKVDQICFDNTVMLDTIINNFEQLTKI
jgi:hypothetical protein